MSHTEILNWAAIYAATAVCCTIASIVSIGSLAVEVWRERAWTATTDWTSRLLFVPKLWLRWQRRYLLSTPVTLAVVGWFALTLDWSR